MKTNIQITLTDDQRRLLANLIDGKESKRMVSRIEVVSICQQHIGGLLDTSIPESHSVLRAHKNNISSSSDSEDSFLLANKCPAYIRGWNQVKNAA